MRILVRAALLLACCVWATQGQAQSSQANSNQGNSNQGNQGNSQSSSSSSNTNSNMPSTNTNASSSGNKQRGIWDEPIRFSTKAKDACTMVISGQGDFTKLRVSCKNKDKSYWCDYLGKPNHCRAYNTNPRHYFTQIMWEMRKMPNACQGPRHYKPLMCKNANDETQMVFHNSWPKMTTPRPSQPGQDRQQQQKHHQQQQQQQHHQQQQQQHHQQQQQQHHQQQQQQQQQQHQQQQQAGRPTTTTKAPAQRQQKPQQAKPVKPQQSKPAGKPSQAKKPTPKPKSTTAKPTPYGEGKATRMAQEYCWKSFQGICAYFISWFQN